MTDTVRRRHLAGLPAWLAAGTVATQICYPLLAGRARDRLTIAIVLLFAATSIAHAWRTRGRRIAVSVLVLTALPGLAVEVIGVHTGVPFGRYGYSDVLGPQLLDVPVVIALAWTMFAWPAALVARRLVHGRVARVVVGTWALASWDLFLDPQMVAAGRWRWRYPTPHLPGVDAVPLTNYVGWLVVALVMSLVLQAILGVDSPGAYDDRIPLALFVWTWASSTLALAAFLSLGAAAAWGAFGMGLVAVPLLVRLVRDREASR